MSFLSCTDGRTPSYPSGADENIVGNDDGTTDDENNFPYPAGNNFGYLKSEDAPSRVIKFHEGRPGDYAAFDLFFREFTRLKIGDAWYRISPFYPWKVKFAFKKVASQDPNGSWTRDPASQLVNNSN
jgi:hypothetical protein